MKRYGFDIDEILCDFVPTLISTTNEYFGTNVRIEDMTDYYISIFLGIEKEEMDPVMNILGRYENVIRLPALIEGISLVKELKREGNFIALVTARGEDLREATLTWLEDHSVPYDELRFTNHETKEAVAKELNLDCFIEDNPRHGNPVAEIGIPVFMPRYPWNRDKQLHKNITLVNNCTEIRERLKK